MSLSLCDLHFVSDTFRDGDKGAMLGSHLAMCLNSLLKPARATLAYQRQHRRAASAPFLSYLPEPANPSDRGWPWRPRRIRAPAPTALRRGAIFGFAALAPAACFLEVFASTRG